MTTGNTERKRGNTVRNPATTTYSTWTWIKGYAALVALTPVWCLFWFMANVVKKLPPGLTAKLLRWHKSKTAARPRDVRIPTNESVPAYMLRWWHIKRNAYFNWYLHNVLRSDDDTALHDHPWWSFSLVLDGGYYEHTIAKGGVHYMKWFGPGQMHFRPFGSCAHRLQLPTEKIDDASMTQMAHSVDLDITAYKDRQVEMPATTMFLTGPVLRRWGFHHPERWVDAYDWDEFCQERGIGGEKMAGYANQLDKPRNTN
jgi:hypothetical protein